jgi:hypothetical protein
LAAVVGVTSGCVGSTVGSGAACVTVGVGVGACGAVARPAKKLPAATIRKARTSVVTKTLLVFGFVDGFAGDGDVAGEVGGVASELDGTEGVDSEDEESGVLVSVEGVEFTCVSSAISYYEHIYIKMSIMNYRSPHVLDLHIIVFLYSTVKT